MDDGAAVGRSDDEEMLSGGRLIAGNAGGLGGIVFVRVFCLLSSVPTGIRKDLYLYIKFADLCARSPWLL